MQRHAAQERIRDITEAKSNTNSDRRRDAHYVTREKLAKRDYSEAASVIQSLSESRHYLSYRLLFSRKTIMVSRYLILIHLNPMPSGLVLLLLASFLVVYDCIHISWYCNISPMKEGATEYLQGTLRVAQMNCLSREQNPLETNPYKAQYPTLKKIV